MTIIILTIGILIMSAVFHEIAHGWVAYKLGDNTAKDAGRLTMNPISHLDPVGSIMVPILMLVSRLPFFIAWAKPVPYNPYNLTDKKYGELKVALGGPGSNFIIALFFGLVARFMPIAANIKIDLIVGFLSGDNDLIATYMQGSFVSTLFVMSIIFCLINLVLMTFNLIPIPPLDGSKVLYTFLSQQWRLRMHSIEPYGMFILIFLLMFGFIRSVIWPIVMFLFFGIIGL